MLLGDLPWRAGNRVLHIGKRAASSGIEKPVVLRVSQPTAVRRKPRLPHFVAERPIRREFERIPRLLVIDVSLS